MWQWFTLILLTITIGIGIGIIGYCFKRHSYSSIPSSSLSVGDIMVDMHPLLLKPAIELATLLRNGTVTSPQIIELYIAQIERTHSIINAVVVQRFDDARREAQQWHRRITSAIESNACDQLPPFAGVPVTVKECFKVTGMVWSAGQWSRRSQLAESDATCVARMRASGMVILGLTNTSELCMWYESNNRVYGRTNNPYDIRCTAGGSSGGEGAAIGAAASLMGLGGDVGGSIRMPSHFNGVFGHKASGGMVPNTGQYPPTAGLIERYCQSGPICRYAVDLWPFLNIIAAPDHHSVHQSVAPWRSSPMRSPYDVDITKLRIINVPLNTMNWVAAVDKELVAAQERVVLHLKSIGCHVETRLFPELRESATIWSSMMALEEGPSFAWYLRNGATSGGNSNSNGSNGNELSITMFLSLIWQLILILIKGPRASSYTLPAIILALVQPITTLPICMAHTKRVAARGASLAARLSSLLGDDGVMLFPSHPTMAPRHNHPLLRPFNFAYTGIFNVLQLPVTQVPLGLSSSSLPLPIGIQVVGSWGRDYNTIAIAMQLERAFGGWQKPPPPRSSSSS